MSERGERGGSLHGITVCMAAVMLPAAIYVGSYLALSEPIASSLGGNRVQRSPFFRFGGSEVELFFWPLTQIDMLARPEYWGSQVHDVFADGSPDPFASKSN